MAQLKCSSELFMIYMLVYYTSYTHTHTHADGYIL